MKKLQSLLLASTLFLFIAGGCGGGSSSPASSVSQCGDGVVSATEQCDDGDQDSGDGCSSTCTTETSGQTMFSKIIHYSDRDQAYSINRTSDGGYVIGGTTVADDAPSSNYTSAMVLKVSSSGQVEWMNSFDGGQPYYRAVIQEIEQTSDGGYIAAGYKSYSSNSSYVRFMVVKLDSSGNTDWEYIDDDSSSYAYSVKQVSGGGYIAGGKTTSDFACVVKLDAQGSLEWKKSFGNTSNDVVNSVIEAADGSFVVAGAMFSSTSSSSGDFWVAKLSSSGETLWDNTLSESGHNENVRDLVQTSDGGFILVGYSSIDNADVRAVKVSAGGQELWAKTYGMPYYYDYVYSITASADGGFVFAGSTNKDGSAWLTKIDSSGQRKWAKILGVSGFSETIYSIVQASDGGFAAVGTSYSSNLYDVLFLKLNANGECDGCFDE